MDYCEVGNKPASDDGYFEEMTKAVFSSGFSRKVIENKWEHFQKAFSGFSVREVSLFDEPDVDRLLKDGGIVRNLRKIEGTIKNARQIAELQKEYGSFRKYLQEIFPLGEEKVCKELSRRFSHLGSSTALFFLRSVGYEMPESTRKWAKSHAGKAKG